MVSFHFDNDLMDDTLIDDIIWSEIKNSTSRGDFVCYLVHTPRNAEYMDNAHFHLKSLSEENPLEPLHYFRAIERIKTLAKSGNATAMFHMGKIHAIGIAVPQDMNVAVSWYEKAIAVGDVRSHSNLGWLYQSGLGVPMNKEKAFELLYYGANHGIQTAKASIALMLLSGEGCTPDIEKGLQLLKEAFNAGYINAGNHLSDVYFTGKYVPKDTEHAYEWLFKVVEQGDSRTAAILGHHLVAGTHGKTDVEKGLELLKASIDAGYMPAYLWIASLYKNGNGVEKNLATAKAWYEKGILAGNMACQSELEKMHRETSSHLTSRTLH